jgi:predicted DNA-binding transcriptional regulator AlpA
LTGKKTCVLKVSFSFWSDIMPTVPIQQHPGDQRAAAAKPVPNRKARTSEKVRQGNPRLWDSETTRAFFGGIDISTLYRGMAAGRYPRPVLVSEHVARWLAEECEAALERLIAARDEPRKKPEHRGRPRGSKRLREAASAAEAEAT